MANSYVTYAGDGSTQNFNLTFPYLDTAHIFATVNGVTAPFAWINTTTLRITTAPPAAAVVKLSRVTPSLTPLVDFTNGSIVTEDQLDSNAKQCLYVVQEGTDQLTTIPALVAQAAASAAAAADSAAHAPPGYSSVLFAGAYGVTANGVTNDTTTMQAAINAAIASGAELRLPPGRIVTGTLSLSGLMKMRGAGWSTVLVPINNAIGKLLNVTGSYVQVTDIQIDGSAIASPTLTGVHVSSGGLTKIERLLIYGVGTGLDVPGCNAGYFDDLRIQNCAVTGVHTGGTAGLYPGDITWRNMVVIPAAAATGLIVDGNTNAQDFGNFKTIGGAIGVNFRGAGAGCSIPDGNFFTTGNFTAASGPNVQVLKATNMWITSGSSIGGSTGGDGLLINPALATDVDGLFVCDTQVRGNFKTGINWVKGANLFLLDCQVYSNSNGGGSGVYSNVLVGAGTTGIFYVDDLMAGLGSSGNLLANVQGPTKYGVELVSGSLGDTTNFPGRLMIDGLFALGNTVGEILDASLPAGANRYIRMKAADVTSVWTTGDVKLTWKIAADAGWIMHVDGTIGSATSGATYANLAAQALFLLLWTNFTNTEAPVVSGRGASAAADWAANKRITMPKALGRVLGVSGAGSGLTARTRGSITGTETVAAEMPSHTHSDLRITGTMTAAPGSLGVDPVVPTTTDTGGTTGAASSGDAVMSIVQPTAFWNVMVKL